MGHFQYYEFQAIDRMLTTAEIAELNSLSSRGIIAPYNAKFIYHYGDFRGKVEEILVNHFDMMMYTSNWGTRRLAFRLPDHLIQLERILHYQIEDVINIKKYNNSVVIDVDIQSDDLSSWIEEEDAKNILACLLPLRNDLMRGDYRSLYLSCMAGYSAGILEEYEMNDIAVPNGLNELSYSLQKLIDFFEIPEDLLTHYAANSSQLQPLNINLNNLSLNEAKEILAKLLNKEPNLDIELIRKLEGYLYEKSEY